jgi:thioredoxin-related protein
MPAPARFAVAALIAALVSSAAPAATAESKLPWRGWDAGLAEARSSGRRVLVDVYTDWCGWCRRMERDVYARPDVREYLDRHYVIVKLDAESSGPASYRGRRQTQKSIAAEFGVTGYPTTLFLKPNGEHLVKAPGYLPADRFLQVLRYVAEGHFESGVPFDTYTKSAPRAR